MRHQIDWEDCQKQLAEKPLRSEWARSSGKTLAFITRYDQPSGLFSFSIEVTGHDTVVYSGLDLHEAVDAFNELG